MSKTFKSKLEQPGCNNLATNKIVCSVAEPQLSILSENLQLCSIEMKSNKKYKRAIQLESIRNAIHPPTYSKILHFKTSTVSLFSSKLAEVSI